MNIFNNKEYFEESRYPFKSVEKDLHNIVNHYDSFECIMKKIKNNSKEKYYVLAMFAYPSGQIHCGHVRNFLYVDLVSRHKRLQGYNVINPIGWDSFGLPAENAAKENNLSPKIWTENNIAVMGDLLKTLGFSFDWALELQTHQPEYYMHQQKLFLKMLEKGLCYKKKGLVLWDPKEETVLAKEQVIDNKGWRSGVPVEMKIMEQWYCKITEYADELIDELENLKDWPNDIKMAQKNWMEKKESVVITFDIVDEKNNFIKKIEVGTTRPSMLYGGTFIALSLTNELTLELETQNKEISDFIRTNLLNHGDENYNGIFTGLYCINPINQAKMPIYVATYVVNDYGTGSVYGCPAHNLNDYNFAIQHNLPIKKILIESSNDDLIFVDEEKKTSIALSGSIIVGDSDWIGENSETFNKKLISLIKNKNSKYSFMKISNFYKLHDWCFSRQRYWGCPIPIINCDNCGVVPVNYENLPVLLPENINFEVNGNPLDHSLEWKKTFCPKCNNKATRETNTMDTFMDSSWYFFRYFSKNYPDIIDSKLAESLLPIDTYIGGREHAVGHLIYCRFITKILRDLGYLNINEPVKKLLNQGIVSMCTYYNATQKKYIFPNEVIYKKITKESDKTLENYDKESNSLLFDKNNDIVIKGSSQKMSKSKKNIISPQEIKDIYGVDVLRFMMISDNPIDKEIEIRSEGFNGSVRFINNIWKTGQDLYIYCENDNNKLKVPGEIQKRIYNLFIDADLKLEKLSVNLFAVSLRFILKEIEFLMENQYSNSYIQEIWKNFLKLLSIITPYIAQAMWDLFKFKNNVFNDGKIQLQEVEIKDEIKTFNVMVNNKFHSSINLPADIKEDKIKEEIIKKLNINPNHVINYFFIANRNMINIMVKYDEHNK